MWLFGICEPLNMYWFWTMSVNVNLRSTWRQIKHERISLFCCLCRVLRVLYLYKKVLYFEWQLLSFFIQVFSCGFEGAHQETTTYCNHWESAALYKGFLNLSTLFNYIWTCLSYISIKFNCLTSIKCMPLRWLFWPYSVSCKTIGLALKASPDLRRIHHLFILVWFLYRPQVAKRW